MLGKLGPKAPCWVSDLIIDCLLKRSLDQKLDEFVYCCAISGNYDIIVSLSEDFIKRRNLILDYVEEISILGIRRTPACKTWKISRYIAEREKSFFRLAELINKKHGQQKLNDILQRPNFNGETLFHHSQSFGLKGISTYLMKQNIELNFISEATLMPPYPFCGNYHESPDKDLTEKFKLLGTEGRPEGCNLFKELQAYLERGLNPFVVNRQGLSFAGLLDNANMQLNYGDRSTIYKLLSQFNKDLFYFIKGGVGRSPLKPFLVYEGVRISMAADKKIKANYEIYKGQIDSELVAAKFIKLEVSETIDDDDDTELRRTLAEALEMSANSHKCILKLKEFWIQQVRRLRMYY